jgi:hypothetical protein
MLNYEFAEKTGKLLGTLRAMPWHYRALGIFGTLIA